MRILFILDEFLPENSGGAANVAFGLAKGLKRFGHEISVLTATYDKDLTGKIEIEGIEITRILTQPFGRLRNFKNLKNNQILKEAKKFLIEYKPNIVHIHTLHHRFSYGIIGLAKKFSKAVFLTLHDAQTIYNGKLYPKNNYRIEWIDCLKRDGLVYNPFQRFFIRRVLKKVDKIFAVSNALKNALEANDIFDVEVINNGINTEDWEIGEARGNDVLFAGRVDETKGIEVLIKAFNIAKSEIPDAKLTIVGDGDFKTDKAENIEILPWQDRKAMKRIFTAAKVVVVPSLYLDPFPTVNLEAMAAGKPVVGTCFGGTPEAVVDGETGYIVNPYDEKELADKIIDLLKNPEKAVAFGKAGRERVEKFFGIENQVQKTLFWYKKFIL